MEISLVLEAAFSVDEKVVAQRVCRLKEDFYIENLPSALSHNSHIENMMNFQHFFFLEGLGKEGVFFPFLFQ